MCTNLISRIIYIVLFSQLSLSCTKREHSAAVYELIAHAGGVVDGYTYTNSYEALCTSVDKGYSYIEFDLNLTSDSVLVAARDWKYFNSITGYSHKNDTAPSLNEFLKRRIYGKYTPLTVVQINDFFFRHKELFLVTDKISNPDILEKGFPELKERMVVEAFNYNDYIELVERGFYRVMYSCMADDLDTSIVKHLLLHKLFDGDKIKWITLHTSAFDYVIFSLVDVLCDYKAALFTVNELSEVPAEYSDNIYMLYTDSILPVKPQ